jgi:putative membrane protein
MRAIVFGVALPFLAFAQGEDKSLGKFQNQPQQPSQMNTQMGAPGAGEQANLSQQDKEFLKKAASAGMYEVQAGQLALQKSNDDQVKSLAQHMVDDHTQANEKLHTLAQSENVTLPTQLLPDDQKNLDKLQTKSGKDFDKTYLSQQKDAHKQVLELFQHQAEAGQNPALKSFAQQTVPTLKMHEQMVTRATTKM